MRNMTWWCEQFKIKPKGSIHFCSSTFIFYKMVIKITWPSFQCLYSFVYVNCLSKWWPCIRDRIFWRVGFSYWMISFLYTFYKPNKRIEEKNNVIWMEPVKRSWWKKTSLLDVEEGKTSTAYYTLVLNWIICLNFTGKI